MEYRKKKTHDDMSDAVCTHFLPVDTWITLKERKVVAVYGQDPCGFLQGLLTQDVGNLTRPVFAALLTPQGRFRADLFCVPVPYDTHTYWVQKDLELQDTPCGADTENNDQKDPTGPLERSLFLDVHACFVPDVIRVLSMLGQFHGVSVKDISDKYQVKVLLNADQQAATNLDNTGSQPYLDPRHPGMGLRAIVHRPRTDFARHLDDGPCIFDPHLYHRHRMRLGIPDGAWDLVSERSIPLSYDYHLCHAFSWNKGCYMGQELMARTYHRSQIHKQLAYLQIIKGAFPSKGTSLYDNTGEKVGTMGGHWENEGLASVKRGLTPAPYTWHDDADNHFTAHLMYPQQV